LKTGISYFGNRHSEHFRRDAEEMVSHSIDYVVHTFSETDLAFYCEAMREIVQISHEKGLEVWIDPWAVGGVFGGEAFSKLVATHLNHRQISAGGESLPIACLNNPDFRRFMRNWTDAAIQIGADVLFWDEPHFHIFPPAEKSNWACRCIHCNIGFEALYQKGLPKEETDEVRAFKEHSVVSFLTELCDYVKKQGKKNAVCLIPPYIVPESIRNWDSVAKIPSLDIIGTDPYWNLGDLDVAKVVREYSKRIVELSRRYKREGQIWILNFRIKAGREKDVEVACQAAYEEGIRNIAAWSFKGTGCMSYLACDNPDLVWEVLGSTYQKLKALSDH
jgi:hypothetical protein